HNAFELNHPDAMQGVVGLVNIGHEVTNVNILEDGVPVLTRDLSVGTRRFREDLQREKGLSAEDSERLIQGQAQSGDLAQYVDARAEEIAVGVERAAAFLATASRSAGGLGRVYTVGGAARIPGLNEALGSRLKVLVEVASPVERLKVRDSVFGSVEVDEVAALLKPAVGVAGAGLDGGVVEKRRFDAVIAQKRQSERIRDSLAAEINIIRGIDADRYVWPHVLDQITKALPPYTWLTGVSALGTGTSQPG